MLTTTEYIGSVGVGVTSPQLFRANDGLLYVVKLQRNRMGPKVLANELLAAQLGERLNLCFPPSGVIELTSEVIGRSPKLRRIGAQPGKQFACRYLSRSSYVTPVKLARAVNKQQLAGVMLFDHLLHNVDRTWNRKNLLIRPEKDGLRVYAIDNSHLFLRGRWTEESLANLAGRVKVNRRRAYGVLLKRYLTKHDFEPYIQAVNRLSDQVIAEVISQIPWDWLPNPSERQALAAHICLRREMLPDICRQLFALIPDVHGRTDNN